MKKKFTKNPLSVRKTEEMEQMIEYLENKLQLSPTSIIRLALAKLYNQERSKEGGNYE